MFDTLFSLDYQGPPFVLFSAAHLAGIALVLVACLLVVAALRIWPNSQVLRAGLRHGLAIFSLVNLFAWQVWQYSQGIWTPAYSLPLQICTFSNILCAAMLWSRSYRMFEVLYFWGFAGVLQALLTPDIGRFGFPHFVFLIFFTSHGAIPASVLYMMAAERYRPQWSSIWRATLVTLAFLLVVGVINWLTGGNYMFVGYKPAFPSLIDYLGPWPWYIGSMVLVGAVAFVLVYLPLAVYDAVSRRRVPLRA
ncbi:MAG: TIGR02206 family membrane protein [Roseiflexaceae bacterium]|nr:TIGR02206 family membrane protein [Roseiflexaceae bacterium]